MVQLIPMTEKEFREYLDYTIRDYANEHVKAGNWKEDEAIEKSTKEHDDLLPQGLQTKDNWLFTVRAEDKPVGMIWLARRKEKQGFIYDVNVWDEYQGRGYGKQTMMAIEEVAKEQGMNSIRLHVFGHNKTAQNLYNGLGYKTVSLNMEKNID